MLRLLPIFTLFPYTTLFRSFVHRAVPTDGTDDLLPDIIDGVILALRVLTISDYEFLRLRRRKVRVVNVTEVTHTSEHIITRFTRSSLVRPRRQPVRTFDQAGQSRAFAQRHLLCRF